MTAEKLEKEGNGESKKSKEESESVNSELMIIRRRKRLSIRKNNGIKFGLLKPNHAETKMTGPCL